MNTNEKEQAEQQLRQRCGRYLVAVVRAVLRGEEAPALPPELSWENVFWMANEHSLLAMAFAGIEKQLRAEPELQSRWKRACDECLVQTLTQMSEEPRILAAFSEAGLRVLPVKGSVLRALYARPDHRQMADIDLIVPHEQLAQTEQLMQQLGYQTQPGVEEENEVDCDLPPYLHVEIHDTLLKTNDENYRYYADIWQRAEPDADLPGVFHLRREDEYLYLLLHFLQHYVEAGVGIRQVLDIYLFGQTCGGTMDADYLRRETEKLGIGPMRELVERLAAYWFADQPGAADEELRELEAFCFLSGSYGGYLSRRICLMRKKQKKESGVGWKLQYFWHRLFPPFDILCMRYPKLKTAPWLLPYFWLCRLFDLSYWKNNFHREMATLKQVEQEKK